MKINFYPQFIPRWILTVVLLYFVFQEVGFVTWLCITLLAVQSEFLTKTVMGKRRKKGVTL